MSLRECTECGGRKAIFKTETISGDVIKRLRRCGDCGCVTTSTESEKSPIRNRRETTILIDYRNMSRHHRAAFRGFIRFLKDVEGTGKRASGRVLKRRKSKGTTKELEQ